MRILLYNCFDRLEDDLACLFETPENNVYLAISESDILRILNQTEIHLAILAIEKVDGGLLKILQAYPHTRFYLFDVTSKQIAAYTNLHAVPQQMNCLNLRNLMLHTK